MRGPSLTPTILVLMQGSEWYVIYWNQRAHHLDRQSGFAVLSTARVPAKNEYRPQPLVGAAISRSITPREIVTMSTDDAKPNDPVVGLGVALDAQRERYARLVRQWDAAASAPDYTADLTSEVENEAEMVQSDIRETENKIAETKATTLGGLVVKMALLEGVCGALDVQAETEEPLEYGFENEGHLTPPSMRQNIVFASKLAESAHADARALLASH